MLPVDTEWSPRCAMWNKASTKQQQQQQEETEKEKMGDPVFASLF